MSRVDAQRRRCGAFTLVELLLIVTIVALLVALLMPSLSRARKASVRTRCLSHQRQICLGIQIYAGENNDTLPPREEPYWPAQLLSYYLNPDVIFCPSDPSRAGLIAMNVVSNSPSESSYILNAFNYDKPDGTVIDEEGTSRSWGVAVDLRRITDPADAILLAEKINYSPTVNSFYMDLAGNDQLSRVNYARHEGGGNYTFVDGHSQFLVRDQVTSPHNLWTASPLD